MPFRKLAPLSLCALALNGIAAHAADNELYAAPPPDDAAFLRWIEDDQAPSIMGISSLGKSGNVFHPVSAALTNGAAPGVYYTAARSAAGQLVVIQEPPRADRSKVLVTLLNLTDTPVILKVVDLDIEVIGATSANLAGARAVNPVAARLTVLSEDGTDLGSFDVKLRRGQNVTFVARPDGAAFIENSFGENLEG